MLEQWGGDLFSKKFDIAKTYEEEAGGERGVDIGESESRKKHGAKQRSTVIKSLQGFSADLRSGRSGQWGPLPSLGTETGRLCHFPLEIGFFRLLSERSAPDS